jgi:hypothetical protein
VLAILYSLAAALEVFGLAVTIADIQAAQQRLAEYFSRPVNVYATDAVGIAEAFDPTVATTGGEPPTLEQRIEVLEEWRRSVAGELDRRGEQLRTQTMSRIQAEVSAARDSLNDRLEGLREYVVGEPRHGWWGIYRGPLLLVGGVFLGLIGNLVSLAT